MLVILYRFVPSWKANVYHMHTSESRSQEVVGHLGNFCIIFNEFFEFGHI